MLQRHPVCAHRLLRRSHINGSPRHLLPSFGLSSPFLFPTESHGEPPSSKPCPPFRPIRGTLRIGFFPKFRPASSPTSPYMHSASPTAIPREWSNPWPSPSYPNSPLELSTTRPPPPRRPRRAAIGSRRWPARDHLRLHQPYRCVPLRPFMPIRASLFLPIPLQHRRPFPPVHPVAARCRQPAPAPPEPRLHRPWDHLGVSVPFLALTAAVDLPTSGAEPCSSHLRQSSVLLCYSFSVCLSMCSTVSG